VYYSQLAGGLDVFRPRESGRAFVQAFKLLSDYRNNPTTQGGAHGLMQEMRAFGVDMPSIGMVEMGGPAHGRLVRIMDAELNKLGPNPSLLDILNSWGKVLRNKGSAARENVAQAYDLIDRTFKAANYLSLRQRFLRKYNGDVNAAANEAAKLINYSFPNPQNVGRLVEKARQYPFLLNQYMTYATENVRIHAMIAPRMYRDFKALATGNFADVDGIGLRMLAGTMFLYGISQSMRAMRLMNGISDEEAKAVIEEQVKRKRAFRPLVMVMPTRDENDRAWAVDLSQWLPIAPLVQGHPDAPLYKRIIANVMLKPMVAGSMSETALDQFFDTAGILPSFDEYELREDQKGAGGIARELVFRSGMVPGFLTRTYETLRKGGMVGTLGRTEEQLTPMQMGVDVMANPQPLSMPGARQMPAAASPTPAFDGVQLELARRLRELDKEATAAIRAKGLEVNAGKAPPSDIDDIALFYEAQMQAVQAELEQKQRIMQEAIMAQQAGAAAGQQGPQNPAAMLDSIPGIPPSR
jgi:hypothetical protein